MQRIGYARVSTKQQDTDRQVTDLVGSASFKLSNVTGKGPYGDYCPYLHIAPNGLIFHSVPTPNMQYWDWRGAGAIYTEGVRLGNDQHRLRGSDTLFADGKILMTDGSPGWTNGPVPAASTAVEIDLNAANGIPVVTQVGSMA